LNNIASNAKAWLYHNKNDNLQVAHHASVNLESMPGDGSESPLR